MQTGEFHTNTKIIWRLSETNLFPCSASGWESNPNGKHFVFRHFFLNIWCHHSDLHAPPLNGCSRYIRDSVPVLCFDYQRLWWFRHSRNEVLAWAKKKKKWQTNKIGCKIVEFASSPNNAAMGPAAHTAAISIANPSLSRILFLHMMLYWHHKLLCFCNLMLNSIPTRFSSLCNTCTCALIKHTHICIMHIQIWYICTCM